jgi:hypothetical protein
MTTHSSTQGTSTHSQRGRGGDRDNIRDRARETAADAFQGKGLTFRHLNQVVSDVLSQVADEVRSALPEDRRNKLRQVFDGLGDAVSSAAAASQKALRDTRTHAAKLVTEHGPAAARRISEANDQFLDAVSGFSSRAATEIRSELDDLVRSARRAGPRVVEGVQSAARAAGESRVADLAGDAARSTAKFAQRAARDAAMAVGGLMEGLADAIKPPQAPRPAAKKAKAPAKGARTAKKTKTTGKSGRAASTRSKGAGARKTARAAKKRR